MKRLYLVRHGQTEYNVARLIQGRCDSPLTDKGLEQARTAASWLRGQGAVPDAVVSSPLGRAMKTAELLAEGVGFRGAVEPEPRIIERSYGTFEAGPFSELPCDVWDPGEDLVAYEGEGNVALRARMEEGLQALVAREDVDCAIAVSHGSACRQFITMHLPEGWEVPGKLPNCGIFIFDYDEDAESFALLAIVDPMHSEA